MIEHYIVCTCILNIIEVTYTTIDFPKDKE